MAKLAAFCISRRRDIAFAEAVKPHRVVVEHFPFEIIGQIFARVEVGQVAAELVALARKSPTLKPS
jgi:hypothetical protein